MDRRCYKCKEVKPLEEFKPDKRRKSGKAYICKKCFNIYKYLNRKKNNSYSKYVNSPERREWSRNNVKILSKKKKEIKEELKSGGCVLCGYNTCMSALDFHHINPSIKGFAMSRPTLSGIEAEARKCVVLCATCHR